MFHGGEHNGAAGGRRRGACATAASFVITLEMDEVSGDNRDSDDDRGEKRRGEVLVRRRERESVV